MRKSLKSLFLILIMGMLWSSVNAFERSEKIVCGTNEKNEIWCTSYNGIEYGKWERLPGSLKKVIVRDGQLWGVNAQGEIYYAADITSPQWVHLDGHAK